MSKEEAAWLEAHNTITRVIRFIGGEQISGWQVQDADEAVSLLGAIQRYIDGQPLALTTLAARAEERNWRERLAGKHQ
jgi:hypothetical protein